MSPTEGYEERLQRSVIRSVNTIADGLVFSCAFLIGVGVRSRLDWSGQPLFQKFTDHSLLLFFCVFCAGHVLSLRLSGTYPVRRTRSFDDMGAFYLRSSLLATGALLITAFLSYSIPSSRVVIMTGSLSVFPLMLLKEAALRAVLRSWRRTGYNIRRAVLVGAHPASLRAAALEFDSDPLLGTEVVGTVGAGPGGVADLPNLGTVAELDRVISEHIVDVVIFIDFEVGNPENEAALWKCEMRGIEALLRMSLFRRALDKVFIDRIGNSTYLSFRSGPQDAGGLIVKYAADRALSLILLVFFLPVMLVIAALIKLDSPGPVLFRQKRVGLNGRTFNFYKFRSMVTNAEQLQETLWAHNQMQGGHMFKMDLDPRVTRVGAWLRKTSLDELPQFWNVLCGHMSLVGPRPSLPSEVVKFDSWQRRRLSMKPGITCIWQVSGRNQIVDFRDWARLDLQYIDHWSLWLDLKLLFLTIPAVVIGRGAK